MSDDVILRWPELADDATVGGVTINAYKDSAMISLEPHEFTEDCSATLTVDELRRVAAACALLADRLESRGAS